jgi:hypothetical protein
MDVDMQMRNRKNMGCGISKFRKKYYLRMK